MGIVDNALIGASGQGGYFLFRSLRFRSSASAYLNRTPASAGNRQIFTLSAWVKRGKLTSEQAIIVCRTGSSTEFGRLVFNSSDQLDLWIRNSSSTTLVRLVTTQVFRDPSAWYHVVMYVDTTQATAANRAIFYINGVQVTAYGTATYPSQNTNLDFNTANLTAIGVEVPNATYLDGYLAEVNFIDGQALTPSSFGSTNTLTGVWQPARYAGTYGTNGFYLPFTDNSALTTSSNVGLGKDFSGNGNYWVTNNISLTSGVTYDSMTDVPTLTSATAANFAVGNPLAAQLASGWNIATMQAGNLNWGSAADNQNKVGMATMSMTSGKYYWEITIGSNFPATSTFLGITKENQQSVSKSTGVYYRNDGQKVIDSTSSAYGASYTSGDVIGLAYDATAGTLVCYKNNSSQGTLYSSGTGFSWIPTMSCDNAGSGVTYFNNVNFGQRPFAYTPPTGFVALNTFNLPTSTIVKGNTVMDATLWAGNNASPRSITNDAAFKPDLVWIKNRSGTTWHNLVDSVRGVNRDLFSNSTNAEALNDTSGTVSAFNTGGFSVSAGSSDSSDVNATGSNYVGWQWQAGQGTTSTNTAGTISATVSVNASAGFSIATYTGTAAAATVGHGLGVAPQLIIGRSRTNSGFNWGVWHISLQTLYGNNAWIRINTSDTYTTSFDVFDPQNNTSSVFGIGSEATMNASGSNYVAYCWTPIAGYSSFGSYTGNGSTDGPFVYTGFNPKFVMLKRTDSGADWIVYDEARNTYNVTNLLLFPNTSGVEETSTANIIDLLSNGFKLRGSAGGTNGSGGTWIYAAFASNPFKNSLAQ